MTLIYHDTRSPHYTAAILFEHVLNGDLETLYSPRDAVCEIKSISSLIDLYGSPSVLVALREISPPDIGLQIRTRLEREEMQRLSDILDTHAPQEVLHTAKDVPQGPNFALRLKRKLKK